MLRFKQVQLNLKHRLRALPYHRHGLLDIGIPATCADSKEVAVLIVGREEHSRGEGDAMLDGLAVQGERVDLFGKLDPKYKSSQGSGDSGFSGKMAANGLGNSRDVGCV